MVFGLGLVSKASMGNLGLPGLRIILISVCRVLRRIGIVNDGALVDVVVVVVAHGTEGGGGRGRVGGGRRRQHKQRGRR